MDFSKIDPAWRDLIMIVGVLFLSVPVSMLAGYDFRTSLNLPIAASIITIILWFAYALPKQNPDKKIEPFIRNISQEVIDVKKGLTACDIKTHDFENIRIVYVPLMKESDKMLTSCLGSDVLRFSFEIPKSEVSMNVAQFTESAISAAMMTNAEWKMIQNIGGSNAQLIGNSSRIFCKDDKVFVSLSFDWKTAMEKSIQVYDTIRQVKQNLLK